MPPASALDRMDAGVRQTNAAVATNKIKNPAGTAFLNRFANWRYFMM
jgi:hypothetical protein